MQDLFKQVLYFKKKPFLVFFLILILISSIITAKEYTQDYNNPITYSMGDLRWCQLTGCTIADLIVDSLTVYNLSVIGDVFNVTMNIVTWNITDNFNVGGNLIAKNGTFDYLFVNDRVGIGTGSPTDKLDVAGAIRVTADSAFSASAGARFYKQSDLGLVLQGVTGTTTDLSIVAPDGQRLIDNPTGTDDVVLIPISATGNVGIGTSTPAYNLVIDNPPSPQIYSPMILINASEGGSANANYIEFLGSTHNGYVGMANSVPNLPIGNTNGGLPYALQLNNVKNHPIQFATNNIARMTIEGGGDVGIGTINPDSLLHIANVDSGSEAIFRIEGNKSTDGRYGMILFENNGDTLANIEALRTNNNDEGALTFGTQPTGGAIIERMRITSAGDVGIGTTTPGELLEIEDDTPRIAITNTNLIKSSALTLYNPLGLSGAIVSYASDEVPSNETWIKDYRPNGKVVLAGGTGGVADLVVDSTGKVGIGTTDPSHILDLVGNMEISYQYALDFSNLNPHLRVTGGAGTITIGDDDSVVLAPTTGNVGIGNITPQHKLSVNGDIYGSKNLIIRNFSSINQLVIGNYTIADLSDSDSLTVVDGFDLIHTASFSDDHAFEIELDAAGFGDVKAIDIDYTTGAITTGQDEVAILVNIDDFLSTGGTVIGLEVITTEGLANVYGMEVGALVNPILQLSGEFSNESIATVNEVDRLAEFLSITSDIDIFVSDNDNITIGGTAKFEEIEFILNTTSSGSGITPVFEFSTAGDTWTEFNPTDGTNGMRNNGVVVWLDEDIPTWATIGGNYLIQITRTKNSLTTNPIENKIRIVSGAVEYLWDKDGDLSVNEITSNALSGTYSNGEAYVCVYDNGTIFAKDSVCS